MQQTYSVIYFWLEVVLQFVIGIAGFIANLAVVPILCRSGFVQRHTLCIRSKHSVMSPRVALEIHSHIVFFGTLQRPAKVWSPRPVL